MTRQPESPTGINHLVLNVRDLERAHHFWTECLGFHHVGSWERPRPDGQPPARMRFYSGVQEGKLRHHDIALLEQPEMPENLMLHPQVLNHVAVTYASAASWQQQIGFLMAKGFVPFRQIERGATCSAHLLDPDGNEIELVYEFPRSVWEGDINAALNHAVVQPVGSHAVDS